jgi:hypothetical protein
LFRLGFEYLFQCHKSKEEIAILKLDFEKPFDRIEHSTILEILRARGFGERWIKWIDLILGYGTSAILLNGTPAKEVSGKETHFHLYFFCVGSLSTPINFK